ncbi:hypothetical protein GCM10022252_76350 [Streptosporangium oxazolinicum]|uniref:Uncharacterized protein n=1 Tax=Streptosporangium oxazolinicum TaxID=909287 RepID=A0ABP8BL67_9ACTN
MTGTVRTPDLHVEHMSNLARQLNITSDTPARFAVGMAKHHAETAVKIATKYEGDPGAFAELNTQIHLALAYMSRHVDGRGFECVADMFVTLRTIAQTYLRGLSHTQRVLLAAGRGFRHAQMTEENTRAGGDPALITWLNPVYCPTSEALTRIQRAADRRYETRYPDLAGASADDADRRHELATPTTYRFTLEFRYGLLD